MILRTNLCVLLLLGLVHAVSAQAKNRVSYPSWVTSGTYSKEEAFVDSVRSRVPEPKSTWSVGYGYSISDTAAERIKILHQQYHRSKSKETIYEIFLLAPLASRKGHGLLRATEFWNEAFKQQEASSEFARAVFVGMSAMMASDRYPKFWEDRILKEFPRNKLVLLFSFYAKSSQKSSFMERVAQKNALDRFVAIERNAPYLSFIKGRCILFYGTRADSISELDGYIKELKLIRSGTQWLDMQLTYQNSLKNYAELLDTLHRKRILGGLDL